jgi:hypothetical protein
LNATSEIATRAVLPTPPAFGAAGHLHHRIANLARRNGLELVEQRLDHDRSKEHHESERDGGQRSRPDPPAPPCPPHQPIHADREDSAQERADDEREPALEQEVADRLTCAAIALLSPPALVDRPGKAQQGRDDEEYEANHECAHVSPALADTPFEPRQDSGTDNQPRHNRADQQAPQQQPLLAHGVVVRLLQGRRTETVDVPGGCCVRIECHHDLPC